LQSDGLDLDNFIASLSQEGAIDSTGVFTVDPVHARSKLRDYQLAHPHSYIGAVMAAASLAGANSVAVEILPSLVRIYCTGAVVGKNQLADFLSHLLKPKAEPYLRQLALAVNSALALKPARLELASGKYRQHFQPDKDWQSESEEDTPGFCFLLQYGVASTLQRKLKNRLQGLPELHLVNRACAYSAPWVLVNQQRLRPTPPPGECLVTAILEGGPADFQEHLRKSLPKSQVHLNLPGEGPHGGVFALYLDQPECIDFVVDGLAFPLSKLHLNGAWAQVICPQLKRDLSAFSLVYDQTYVDIVDSIRDIFRHMLETFVERARRSGPQAVLKFAPVFNHLGHYWVQEEKIEVAEKLYLEVFRSYGNLGVPFDMHYFEASYALWLVTREQEGLDSYHVREFFYSFSQSLKARYGIELLSFASGNMRGGFQILGSLSRPAVQEFLRVVIDLNQMILGPDHPETLYHARSGTSAASFLKRLVP